MRSSDSACAHVSNHKTPAILATTPYWPYLIKLACLFDSAIFKLKVQNVAFFALAPSLFSRYAYQQAIDERVDNLWRIHQNREKKGLKGTNLSTGNLDERDHTMDRGFNINNGIHLSMDSIVSGTIDKPQLNNPFTRFHEGLAEYPQEHENMDDVKLY